MRKTIFTIIGSALLLTATVQLAAAHQYHHGRKFYPAPAPVSEEFRNTKAAWVSPWGQRDSSIYSGGWSAPAGH